MRTVDELITEALSLPSTSRVLLVEKLIESLEFDVDETLQTLWISCYASKLDILSPRVLALRLLGKKINCVTA